MSALDHRPATVATDPELSLRQVRPRDLDGLRSLAAAAGVVCDELELARLVRSDPAHRLVLCATPYDDGETIVGIGVIELGRSATMPSLVLVDPSAGDGLARAIAEGLVEHARTLAA